MYYYHKNLIARNDIRTFSCSNSFFTEKLFNCFAVSTDETLRYVMPRKYGIRTSFLTFAELHEEKVFNSTDIVL